MRKKVVAGNWKMNKTNSEAMEFLSFMKDRIDTREVDVIVAPTYISLETSVKLLKNTDISVAAQNMYFEEKGAYTGEVSGEMLKDIGVKYVIIGHSERRQMFAESDEEVNKKTIKALNLQLIPIVCVGETLNQREENKTKSIVENQITKALKNIDINNISKVIIAYEPIWAIGTGKTATSEQAEEVCKFIRDIVEKLYDKEVAETIKILYGGSVTKDNSKELFLMENIDGGLIGGASLKEDFTEIIENAK